MHIIYRGRDDSLTFYFLQRTVFENNQLKAVVQAETRPLEYDPNNPPLIETQEILIPNDALAPDLETSVVNWLTTVGMLKGGIIVSDTDFPLEKERHDYLRRVKMLRNFYDYGIVETPYGPVDSDPDSQRKISGAVVMALILDTQFSVPWRLSDNTILVCDKEMMINIGLTVAYATTQCQENKNYLDDLINAATDINALASISIANGWPGTPEHSAPEMPSEEPTP